MDIQLDPNSQACIDALHDQTVAAGDFAHTIENFDNVSQLIGSAIEYVNAMDVADTICGDDGLITHINSD